MEGLHDESYAKNGDERVKEARGIDQDNGRYRQEIISKCEQGMNGSQKGSKIKNLLYDLLEN